MILYLLYEKATRQPITLFRNKTIAELASKREGMEHTAVEEWFFSLN
jgi:hypothetical protein